jgi:uncharacterized membrane protein
MTRVTLIFWAVLAILSAVVAIVALSVFNHQDDRWLPVAMVLAASIGSLITAAVEIAKATHKRWLDEDKDGDS